MDTRWIGIALMGGFTLLWASWAFGGGSVAEVLGIVEVLAGIALLAALVPLFGAARPSDPAPSDGTRTPPTGGAAPARARRSPVLLVAIAVEVVAILVAVQIVRRIDPELIQPVIALVVGAHFLVFWFSPATRHVLHLVMTASGCIVGVAGIAAIAAGAPPASVHAGVGLAMGVVTVVYGAVFVAMLRDVRRARRTVRPRPSIPVPGAGTA